ncbi:MAG: hypothetical protein HYT37_03215 [Candidatus Sungbacteria bacterium]|nr:hypothetical protein [Candidatus Sungbacteria bacterium]
MRKEAKRKIELGRIPLPQKTGGPQGSPKGNKGYNRKKQKEFYRRQGW